MNATIRRLARTEIEPHIPLLLEEGFTPEIDQGIWLGAYIGGTLAGWIRVFAAGDDWMLEDVYVLPEFRRHGIASELINEARRGRDPLWLICDDEMIRYYQELDFRVADKAEFPEALATLYAAKKEWPAAPDHDHTALWWSAGDGREGRKTRTNRRIRP